MDTTIDDIDITFFAKHSGSISGMIRHSIKCSLTHLLISFKETSFTCNKIESLREISLRNIPDMLP